MGAYREWTIAHFGVHRKVLAVNRCACVVGEGLWARLAQCSLHTKSNRTEARRIGRLTSMCGPAVQGVFVDPADAGRIAALNINSLDEKYKPVVFPITIGS
jgi:hypothetical protein